MNKKGFTLVELLAVLVILAAIALITVPIVMKIVDNSQVEGEKNSILGYARAIENDVQNYLILNPGKKYTDYNENISERLNEIDYDGNTVLCNMENTFINNNGKVILSECFVTSKSRNEISDVQKEGENKNYYTYSNNIVKKIDNVGTSFKSYKRGDVITVADDEYYVLIDSDENKKYVTALKKNPLTFEETKKYGTELTSSIRDENGYGLINYENSTDYNLSGIKTVVDAWVSDKFLNGELKKVDGYKARLITYDELDASATQICSSGWCLRVYQVGETWLYNYKYRYWTMSPRRDGDGELSTSSVYAVIDSGYAYDYSIFYMNSFSVRPVINVYKYQIQI